MGFLKRIRGASDTSLLRLPSGSFTLDRTGRMVASTLSQTFPAELAQEIGELVLATFAKADEASLALSELTAHFGALTLTARSLRGGAIVFLAPQDLGPVRQSH